jgi:hypothetical protein
MTATAICTRCGSAPVVCINLCRRCGLAQVEAEKVRKGRAERRQRREAVAARRHQAWPAPSKSEPDAA